MNDTANLKAIAAALSSMAGTLAAISTTMSLRASQLNTLIGDAVVISVPPAPSDPVPVPGSDHPTVV